MQKDVQKETKLTQEVQELKHLIAVQSERVKHLEEKLKFLRDFNNKLNYNKAKVLAKNKKQGWEDSIYYGQKNYRDV
jgi:hypothetical protein